LCDQRDGIVSKEIGVDDANGNVGLIFIKGGALIGDGLASNGIIPLLFDVDNDDGDDDDDDENEKDRFGCCCCLLFLLFEDEKHRSDVCNGGKLRRLPCIKASVEL
jgi:hypothetical protein